MSDNDNSETAMAECGACRAIVPIDSPECSECGISFSGVSDEALGECGACKGLVPLDSRKCPHCGTIFVAEDVVDVLRLWLSNTGITIPMLFSKFDEDGDGQIDSSELKTGLLSLNLADLPPSQVDRLIDTIDADGDGRIDLAELHQTITGEAYVGLGSSQPDDATESVDSEPVDDTSEEPDAAVEDEDSQSEEMLELKDDESDDEDEHDDDDSVVIEDEYDDDSDDEGDEDDSDDIDDYDDEDSDDEGDEDDSDDEGDEDDSDDENLIDEEIDDIIDEIDDDTVESDDSVEEKEEPTVAPAFPSELQRSMMGKKWNDIYWPLIHLAFGLFIALWLINGLGGIGPIGVDGTGGNVELETAYEIGYLDWQEGDIYPCEPEVQVGECKNSLTPLAGEASSMPAGFYWDGLLFMALGGIGLISSLVFHLGIIPGWRARAKAMKEVEDDTSDAQSDDESEETSDVEDEYEDVEISEEDEEGEEDEESIEEDGEADGEEDDIDIGSHVGLSFEDEEVFGTIIEFDDEEETVTIEEDGTGDIVTGYQDDMFLE